MGLKPISNGKQVFENYYFEIKYCRVISVRGGVTRVIQPLKDRVIPTFKLSQHGVNHFITLGEILEFTLGVRINRHVAAH